nr:UMP phosphatase [Klebsiella pneumoniae]
MTIQNIICDIDGVLMHDNVAVPGAAEFIKRILDKGMPLVMLTNYPSQTGRDLANRFATAGIDVPDSAFYTSAMATADFLRRRRQKSLRGGRRALIHELYKAGFTITDVNPDFVIVGETRSFNWEMMHKAAFFVANGARFIATNPDTHGRGFYPACGALCAGIEKISGRKPFYVGKPSPWIIRSALNKMQAHSEQTVIVGDNLRTDILAGFVRGWRLFWYSPASPPSTISTACRSARRGFTLPSRKSIFSDANHVAGRGFHF